MDTKTNTTEDKSTSEAVMPPTEEPLGSLTITDVPELKGQQLRSSARVFKKMKLDTIVTVVPEKSEKKEDIKQDIKKCFRPPLWSSDDKTLFFEALNEYGKDFESIQLYISNKFRKKGVPDHFVKTKEQIRHLYYRTWLKISKYIKFAEGIKRLTQELYALINYGELRKKVGSVNEKYLWNLSKLVYKGSIMLKIKGKNVRIKTPFCRALRKLNQLDDKYEEIKLPNRVNIELRPKDMTTYLKVQSTAQNPRINTYMPLQKRLSSLIACLSKKWQSVEAGMYDKALKSSTPVTSSCLPSEKEIEENKDILNPLLRITPPPDCKIEVPSISLGEYFTRQSICLNSHETRLGISNYYSNYSSYKMMSKGSKKGSRPRTDSVSDKSDKSPHKTSVPNEDENCDIVDTETGTDLKDGAKEAVKDGGKVAGVKNESAGVKNESAGVKHEAAGVKNESAGVKSEGVAVNQDVESVSAEDNKISKEDVVNTQKELERQERIAAIKKGWTKNDSESITLGEIYLMLGNNSKVILEYSWDLPSPAETDKDNLKAELKTDESSSSLSPKPTSNLDLGEPLLKLLSVAKLHYRKNIIKCPCGHVCGVKNNAQLKKDVENKIRKILTDIDKCADETEEKNANEPIFENDNVRTTFVPPPVYLPPKIPINPYFQANAMHLASQIASIQRLTPRYCNRKGRRPRSKQVVVERQLPLLPNNLESGHQIVRMNIISKDESNPPPVPSDTSAEQRPTATITSTFTKTVEQSSTLSQFNLNPEELLAESLKEQILEPSSSSRILNEREHWINSEVGDYSLSSLLGRLESPVKSPESEDSRMSQDVDAQLRSMMAQNSIDFSATFADLAAEVTRDAISELV